MIPLRRSWVVVRGFWDGEYLEYLVVARQKVTVWLDGVPITIKDPSNIERRLLGP